MKSKTFLLIAVTAAIAAVALPGCDGGNLLTHSNVEKKIIVTGIPTTYNTYNAQITLTTGVPPTTKAEATATVTGGQATFVLLDVNGKPFTEGGLLVSYQATLTILGASGTNVGGYIGIAPMVWLTTETTTLTIDDDFKGQGTTPGTGG